MAEKFKPLNVLVARCAGCTKENPSFGCQVAGARETREEDAKHILNINPLTDVRISQQLICGGFVTVTNEVQPE